MVVKMTNTQVNYGTVKNGKFTESEPIIYAGERVSLTRASKRLKAVIKDVDSIVILAVKTFEQRYEISPVIIIEHGKVIETENAPIINATESED